MHQYSQTVTTHLGVELHPQCQQPDNAAKWGNSGGQGIPLVASSGGQSILGQQLVSTQATEVADYWVVYPEAQMECQSLQDEREAAQVEGWARDQWFVAAGVAAVAAAIVAAAAAVGTVAYGIGCWQRN